MGDEQDVMAGLSTLLPTSEPKMKSTQQCDSSSLILLDENRYRDGTKSRFCMAQAILEAMLKQKACFHNSLSQTQISD